jgi:hypothetical protein
MHFLGIFNCERCRHLKYFKLNSRSPRAGASLSRHSDRSEPLHQVPVVIYGSRQPRWSVARHGPASSRAKKVRGRAFEPSPRLLWLNPPPLGGDLPTRAATGGDHVSLARYHGGQAGNGWRGLRDGLDDIRPCRAWGYRCGLGSWDLARNDFRHTGLFLSVGPPRSAQRKRQTSAPASATLGPFLMAALAARTYQQASGWRWVPDGYQHQIRHQCPAMPTYALINPVVPIRYPFQFCGYQENRKMKETLGTRWCRLRGLNSRPSVYKTAALPLS